MSIRVGFVFIGYDQYEELKWTIHNIRHHSPFQDAPIVAVLSGDPDREFSGYGEDLVVHVPNIVEHGVDEFRSYLRMDTVRQRPGIGADHFDEPACHWVDRCGTTSILRNYSAGVNALYGVAGNEVDIVLVTESNILLLDWTSIQYMTDRMYHAGRVAMVETVGDYYDPCILWTGQDIFPQLFLVDWKFCIESRFLFDYVNTRPDVMEITLKDNLDFALDRVDKTFEDDVIDCKGRVQWGCHSKPHFISFAHLDRPIGADNDSSLRWESREKQLMFEKNVLNYFNMCTGECSVGIHRKD